MTVFPETQNLSDAGCNEFIYSSDNEASYGEFLKHITEIIESDCRAFIVDGEIFWNSYSNMTYLQAINEDIVRSHLIENAHSLFCKINKSEENIYLEIYMFPYDSAFLITVLHDAINKSYKVVIPKEFC